MFAECTIHYDTPQKWGDISVFVEKQILAMIYKLTRYILPRLESTGLSIQEKHKIDFQDGDHLGFPIGTILANFDLQVDPILSIKFRVSWPFCSGEEAQNRF